MVGLFDFLVFLAIVIINKTRTMKKQIDPIVICITGGPCAGKTTIMSFLVERLTEFGYRVLIAPESATFAFATGLNPGMYGIEFQKYILDMMLSIESGLYDIAQHSGVPTIILCDRGIMDMRAYVDDMVAHKLTKESGVVLEEYAHRFYKAVIHLETAAYGAESFYTLANNQARTESLESARLLNDRTKRAWIGHPKVICVTNDATKTFEQKKLEVLQEICGIIGLPQPIEDERKFVVDAIIRPSDIVVPTAKVEIHQDYLLTGIAGSHERVRKRGSKHAWVFSHTTKVHIPGSTAVIERDKIISKDEYLRLLQRKDPVKRTVIKDRYCFLFDNLYFEIDFFKKCKIPELKMLEVESTKTKQFNQPPPFLAGHIREVTGDPEYSNYTLADF